MIKNINRVISILVMFVLLFTVNVQASTLEENGLKVNITTNTEQESNNKVKVNIEVENKTGKEIKNLSIKGDFPKEIDIEESNKEIKKDKLSSNEKFNTSMNLTCNTKKNINISIVIAAIIILVILVVVFFFIKKRKIKGKKLITGVILVAAISNCISPICVNAEVINNTMKIKDKVKIGEKSYNFSLDINYDIFQKSEYEIAEEDKKKLSNVIEELYYFTLEKYYNYEYKYKYNDNSVYDLKKGIPVNDEGKMLLLYYIYNNHFNDFGMRYDLDNSGIKLSKIEVKDIFKNLFNMDIDDKVFSDEKWEFDEDNILFMASNRGEAFPKVIIDNIEQVDEENVEVNGTIKYMFPDEENEAESFKVKAKINDDSIAGGLTILEYSCENTYAENYALERIKEYIGDSKLDEAKKVADLLKDDNLDDAQKERLIKFNNLLDNKSFDLDKDYSEYKLSEFEYMKLYFKSLNSSDIDKEAKDQLDYQKMLKENYNITNPYEYFDYKIMNNTDIGEDDGLFIDTKGEVLPAFFIEDTPVYHYLVQCPSVRFAINVDINGKRYSDEIRDYFSNGELYKIENNKRVPIREIGEVNCFLHS